MTNETELELIRKHYGDEAVNLINDGWTVDSALNHVGATCDQYACSHPSHQIPEVLADAATLIAKLCEYRGLPPMSVGEWIAAGHVA